MGLSALVGQERQQVRALTPSDAVPTLEISMARAFTKSFVFLFIARSRLR